MQVYKKMFFGLTALFLLTSLLFYFMTENLYLTLGYGVICLGSEAFLSLFKYRKYENKKIQFNECV